MVGLGSVAAEASIEDIFAVIGAFRADECVLDVVYNEVVICEVLICVTEVDEEQESTSVRAT